MCELPAIALGEIDDPHATRAEQAQEPIRPDVLADSHMIRVEVPLQLGRDRRCCEFERIGKGFGSQVRRLGQESLKLWSQGGIVSLKCAQELLAST